MPVNNLELAEIQTTYDPKRWRDTEQRYTLFIEQHPHAHTAYYQLGQLYLHHTLIDKAVSCFQNALSLYSLSSDYYLALGQAYLKQAKFDKALDALLRAYEMDPKADTISLTIGALYEKIEQTDAALTWYSKALQSNPESEKAHYQVGLFFLKQNRFEHATKQFNNVLALNPNHLMAYFYLASIALNNNELEKAQDCYLKALAIDEENADCLVNLGTIKLKKQKPQEAIHCFAKALSYDNRCIEAQHNLASTFMEYDRFDNALTHYEELIKNDPSNIEYLYNMGVANMMLGELDKAIHFFNQTLHLQPQHVDSIINLAAVYSRQNNTSQTLYYLQEAIRLNPNDKASQFMLDALTRQSVTEAPNSYIKQLFDNYAFGYDYHLKETLRYNLPERINDTLSKHVSLSGNDILELGAGTGLLGPVLKPFANTLFGVDLSPKMLTQAKKTGCYHALIESDIIQYLKVHDKDYDLIVASDVLPYFGKLSELFVEIQSHLSSVGLFIFTIEESPTSPYQLTQSGRFQHHPSYLEDELEAAGLLIKSEEPITARYQNNEPVPSRLYIAKSI